SSGSTGFKAPQMQRLFAAQTSAQIQFVDQVYCDAQGGTDPTACDAISHPVVQGGNLNLKEETSFSFNVGAVAQPANNHSISLDFWYYDLEDLVEAPDFQALTQQEADGVNIGQYGAVANRDASGRLIGRGLEASFLNIASTETQGIDIAYNGKMPTSIGDFKLRFEHSHMIYYKTETLPGTGVSDLVGGWGRPRWRNNTTLFYIPNVRNEFSILARTIGQNAKRRTVAGRHPTYTEYDFRYSISLDSLSGKLTVGVTNLLGTLPPADDSSPLDPDLLYQLYDGRGRAFFVGYRQFF
ncbi:MAG: TonB-dependent receptor, partial [Bdellovibrionales bacterium]|nr:TonB-dependent receptor [Bdellovibrionales bacterium]NQZ19237.1 TonB-dependent receptor [Bdellovibrionales bacterium]